MPNHILMLISFLLLSFQGECCFRANPKLPPQGECGVPFFEPSGTENASHISSRIVKRIVNGDSSVPNSWPWMVSIRLKSANTSHFCSGSLVYPGYVHTTAHCFNARNYNGSAFTIRPIAGNYTGSNFLIIVGLSSLNLGMSQGEEGVYFVSDLIIHPQYDRSNGQNDIAFLKLSSPVTLTNKVQLICLPPSSSDYLVSSVYEKFIMGVGWGRTSAGPNDPSENSNDLKQAELEVLSPNDSRCKANSYYDPTLMYCVLGVRRGTNFCWGDSGGPMSVLLDGKWTVFGNTNTLVVKPDGSCDPLFPAYYTKLPLYLNWMATFIK